MNRDQHKYHQVATRARRCREVFYCGDYDKALVAVKRFEAGK